MIITATTSTKLQDYEFWLRNNPEHPDYNLMLQDYQLLKSTANDNRPKD